MSSISATVNRIRRTLEGCSPKLSFGLCLFEDGFALDLFGFLIALPFLDRYRYEPHEIMEAWRVYYHERSVWFNWGRHYKAFRMPWDLEHIKHEVLRPDGTWAPYVGSWETGKPIRNTAGVVVFDGGKEPDGRWEGTYLYRYTLRNGEVQRRLATVHVERREWRQRWLRWCPLFALRRQSIDVKFDGEVGERTGSWKGGTVGCGYDMLPGENALETLRRMERERKFN